MAVAATKPVAQAANEPVTPFGGPPTPPGGDVFGAPRRCEDGVRALRRTTLL